MIRLLRMENFKCFENQDVELGALTLLSGLNGMGKSTVMQALLLLRQSYQQGLLQKIGLIVFVLSRNAEDGPKDKQDGTFISSSILIGRGESREVDTQFRGFFFDHRMDAMDNGRDGQRAERGAEVVAASIQSSINLNGVALAPALLQGGRPQGTPYDHIYRQSSNHPPFTINDFAIND